MKWFLIYSILVLFETGYDVIHGQVRDPKDCGLALLYNFVTYPFLMYYRLRERLDG